MDLSDDDRATLFRAGSDALRFNAPLGDDRARALVDELGRRGVRSVVDLGCGRGGLARLVTVRLDGVSVTGVDADADAVTAARTSAAEAGLGDRVRFEVGDAATWCEPVDAAIAVGVSHAFGGPAAQFARLANLAASGIALVGDGVWETEPDAWCLTNLGEQPTGAGGLAALAEAAGWTVLAADLSTQDEWDAFEGGWVAGVRSVGSPVAEAFAAERERQYREHYRGVLAFCWLVLTRSPSR